MIVVSLKRSYPNLIDDVRAGTARMPFAQLEGITRGDWPKMSPDKMEGFLDFVVGTHDGMIVTAYPIGGVKENSDGTIRFQEPDEDGRDTFRSLWSSNGATQPGEWLVGCPMPGGPWKQGEARGTRRYSLSDYLDDHPALRERQDQDWGGRMGLNLLDHFATGKAVDLDDYPQLQPVTAPSGTSVPPAGGVTVVRQPGGTVIITIPTGVRAQVNIEPGAPVA